MANNRIVPQFVDYQINDDPEGEEQLAAHLDSLTIEEQNVRKANSLAIIEDAWGTGWVRLVVVWEELWPRESIPALAIGAGRQLRTPDEWTGEFVKKMAYLASISPGQAGMVGQILLDVVKERVEGAGDYGRDSSVEIRVRDVQAVIGKVKEKTNQGWGALLAAAGRIE
ncbi:Hypothetical protein D9617_20g028900 [Elsinoe fawcettii]|nr:Hypothetical protein D9617_20g028900 [Elsinoe fawcettii]